MQYAMHSKTIPESNQMRGLPVNGYYIGIIQMHRNTTDIVQQNPVMLLN